MQPMSAPDQCPRVDESHRAADRLPIAGHAVVYATLAVTDARIHVCSMVPASDNSAHRMTGPPRR